MILNKTTISAALATMVLGALMINPASAASKKSSLTATTRGQVENIQPTVGGKEAFSPFDLSAVTHGDLAGDPSQVHRVSPRNYRHSDLNWVTHFTLEIPPTI